MMKYFGRYQVVKSLGKSGADEVFLARTVDAHGADFHVVKHIHDAAFENARRSVRLRHPNLVSVRELGAEAGRWYVATEYVHGEDLRRLLSRVRRTDEQVPIALVTAIGAAVAAGLHHAHTHQGPRRAWRGIVHGGVSPANIVIGYDGSVKLGELGVAAADESYLAPEQVTGGPIDRRTDVFALGAVLYELATARRLFRAPSEFLTRAAIAEPNIPAPSRFRRGLPRALENIILKALAPAPSARFRSAGELRAALEAFARGLGMRQSPAGIADYLKQLFGVRPFPWLSAARTRAGRSIFEISELDERDRDLLDDGQLGVAAPPDSVLRELGVPEARALEATPGRGTRTPMSWTSQTAPASPPSSRRRIAVLAGAAAAAALAGFVLVGALSGNGGGDAVAPMSAPPPPPAPAAAPDDDGSLPPLPDAPPGPVPVVLPPDALPDAISGPEPAAARPAPKKPRAR